MENNNNYNELEEILRQVREKHPELQINDEPEELPPPEPKKTEPPAEEPEPKEEKPAPKLKPNKKIVKANFKTRVLPKAKAFGKIAALRYAAIAVIAAAVVAGLVFGGIKVYEYAQVAYLKPYIEKYGIEFPDGIREEFCDAYGNDQTVAGKLVISDTSTDVLVNGSGNDGAAVLEFGGTVLKKQHVRSIALDSGESLEKDYSTAAAFKNASQLVTFRTLFDDEEYKVIAAYYANTNPDNDDGYVFPYNAWGNMTERSFKSYIDRVGTRSLYLTGIETNYEDCYLSINMPTSTEPDSRFVVLCKRVNKDEKFEKTLKTKPNRRIRKTQKWYDENGEDNPYKLAAKWYPEIYVNKEKTKTKQLTAKDFEG